MLHKCIARMTVTTVMDGGSEDIAGTNFYRPKVDVLFLKKRYKVRPLYIAMHIGLD